ncbi:hypothetical protein [Microbacterium sp. SS28]|uniref:hypothetical protein n=1 Tax=Microbacterium sp. SS28 TaxID=2919948 RepID=UPI001FA9F112|nr:hypothetical protein [Microbacterium sp. SS28]
MLHSEGLFATAPAPRRSGVGRALRSVVGYSALLLAVGLSAFVGVELPLVLFLAVAGIGFFALAWFRPKTALALTLIGALISPQLQAALGSVGGIADEALIFGTCAAIAARRLVAEKTLVWLPGMGWFVLFLFAGALGAVLYGTPLSISLQGATLLAKCFVFAFAVAQVHWSPKDLQGLAKSGFILALVLIATGFVNLVIPGPWTGLFGGSPVQFTAGIPSIIGPFRQPAAFGRMAVIIAASILVYQFFVRSSWFGYAAAFILAGLALLTFRVKSLVGLLTVSSGLVLRAGRPMLLFVIAGVIPAALAIVGPGLFLYVFGDVDLYYGEGAVSARSRLTDGGLGVAQTYFPLGVGFGRYGSATAADYYSPEYIRLGFQYIYGIGSGIGMGKYLNDTQWPALLGETGWLGTIAFVIGAILAVRVLFFRVADNEPSIIRWIRLSGICWFALIMLDSVAAPAFSSPPSYLFLFAAPAIIASIRSDLRAGSMVLPPLLPAPVRSTTSSAASSAALAPDRRRSLEAEGMIAPDEESNAFVSSAARGSGRRKPRSNPGDAP